MLDAVHGPMPGRASRASRTASGSAPGARSSPSSTAAARARTAPARWRVSPIAGSSGRSRTTEGEGIPGRSDRAARRPIIVVAAAAETCCPSTVRTGPSHGSAAPGIRRPGRRATSGASRSSLPSARSIASMSASRSNTWRASATARPRSGSCPSAAMTSTATSAVPPATTGRSDTTCSSVVWRTAPSATPVRPGMSCSAIQSRTGPGAKGCRTASATLTAAGPAGRPRRTSVGEAWNVRRKASLNCRTLPKPAAKATRVTGRSVWSRSIRANRTRRIVISAAGPAP